MALTLTLAPRDAAKAPDAGSVNAWLEARDSVQRLDADAFVIDISSGDISNQAEVFTAHDGEPLRTVRIEAGTVGIPYGFGLVSEVRKLAEDLAAAFDLVVVVGTERLEVSAFFDAGRF